jgi:hypothetical protein
MKRRPLYENVKSPDEPFLFPLDHNQKAVRALLLNRERCLPLLNQNQPQTNR